jgi:NAD(P)-dependent dehydrogenase (short-subunit alcohol dehydrogenase family)
MPANQHNPFSLDGKRIIITGASSGIGRACAIELSKLGATVILVARREDQLKETHRLLHGEGHLIEPFDLTRGEEIVIWMKNLCARSGNLDGLLHSAGIIATLPIRATSQEVFRNIISANLESAYFLSKGFRQKGVRNQSGSLVFISSVMGIVGQPGLSAYCASKGGLVTLAKALALELAREAIRVNVIAPGIVRTDMANSIENSIPADSMMAIEASHPLGIGRPQDIAHAAAYLFSDASRWVTGATLVVDGGYTAA